MADVTITLDTDELDEHFSKIFDAVKVAEEHHPDSLSIYRLHRRLTQARNALIDRLPPEVATTMSGGDKPPPPPGGEG